MNKQQRLLSHTNFNKIIHHAEHLTAAAVIVGLIIFTFNSTAYFLEADWSSINTFYYFIRHVLLLAAGLELAKLLVLHSISPISDLLAFIVASQLLEPEATGLDIILSVTAFAIIFIVNTQFKPDPNPNHPQDHNHPH